MIINTVWKIILVQRSQWGGLTRPFEVPDDIYMSMFCMWSLAMLWFHCFLFVSLSGSAEWLPLAVATLLWVEPHCGVCCLEPWWNLMLETLLAFVITGLSMIEPEQSRLFKNVFLARFLARNLKKKDHYVTESFFGARLWCRLCRSLWEMHGGTH